MAAGRLNSISPGDEAVQGAVAKRSQDEAIVVNPDPRSPEAQVKSHSPQPIPGDHGVSPESTLSQASTTTMSTLTPVIAPASSPKQSGASSAGVEIRRPLLRSVPQSDPDGIPCHPPSASSPPRSSLPADYHSSAAEAISRFRPSTLDVIIGIAPHLFDERRRRPFEAPRSNMPDLQYDRQPRASPLRQSIVLNEDKFENAIKKGLTLKLSAKDLSFGEDKRKSPRLQTPTSCLTESSHRASIIDISFDGATLKSSSRAKSSPNLKSLPPTTTEPDTDEAKPKSRLKSWTKFKKSSNGVENGGGGEPAEDCGICYPLCNGECSKVTFAKYDRRERRSRSTKSSSRSKSYRDFRDSPEWKEFRETQTWTSHAELLTEEEELGLTEVNVARSKSESNLKDLELKRYQSTVTMVKGGKDSLDSSPEESPSSSSEDVRIKVLDAVSKEKFRWRNLGIRTLFKIKPSKAIKAL